MYEAVFHQERLLILWGGIVIVGLKKKKERGEGRECIIDYEHR